MSDPVLISIAAALAGRAATSIYDLVKKKFAIKPEATAALEAAADAPDDSERVRKLAEELSRAEADDPRFGEDLRTEWKHLSVTQHAESGGVVNQISGQVTGKVIQAGDIHGDISF